MSEVIRVPDIGSDSAVDVIEVSVNAGDVIEPEQTIVVLESDKASVEVPAPKGGKVARLLVKVGDRVSQDDPLLELDVEEGASADTAASESPSEPASRDNKERTGDAPRREVEKDEGTSTNTAEREPGPRSSPTESGARDQTEPSRADALDDSDARAAPGTGTPDVYAGPAVRKLAREMGVDLRRVKGTGPRARITPEDVHAFVKHALEGKDSVPAAGSLPDIDFSRFGDVERVELGKIRKLTARNLHRNWQAIPHVTQHEDADVTELEAFRKNENERLAKQDVKLTMLAFLAKASAVCLKEFPDFNSSLENSGDYLVRKKYVHIGVAVDTPNGLVVPVVRDVDRKGLVEIAQEVAALAGKARAGKLTPKDMQGASFSISSLGGIGGTAFTPIINWPEVAILGASRAELKPAWNGEKFKPRLILPLSLSYDHRVIDGAAAARFCVRLAEILSDFRRAAL